MIEIQRDGQFLRITFPYDADLKDAFSGLPKSQRRWDGKSWLVLENDPDQQPDEETNLEYVRSSASECATRRGWKIYDRTLSTASEIEASIAADAEAELNARINAIVELLPKLPPRILKMVRWGDRRIRLQLSGFLEDKELFMQLYCASQSAFKVGAIASFDMKQSFGFAFEIDNHPRSIEALMKLEVQYLKKHDAKIGKLLDSGLVQLLNSEGIQLIGIPIDSVNMSEINYSSQSWELAIVDGIIYWVAETEKFLLAWLEENSYSIATVGGVIGHCIPKSSGLIQIIRQWELQGWFEYWSRSLLLCDDFTHTGKGWSEWQWQHPSDALLRHFKNFPNTLQPIVGNDCDRLINRIQQRKTQLMEAKKEEDRANCQSLAAAKLRYEYGSKTKLIEFACTRITVKKSWTIDRIIGELCADREFCLTVIGL